MFPQRELIRLAAHKAALQKGIGLRRAQCVAAAAGVGQPLAWIDRMLAFWRRLKPLTQIAAVPLGFLFARAIVPRVKILSSLARWGPLVFGAARGQRAAKKIRLKAG